MQHPFDSCRPCQPFHLQLFHLQPFRQRKVSWPQHSAPTPSSCRVVFSRVVLSRVVFSRIASFLVIQRVLRVGWTIGPAHRSSCVGVCWSQSSSLPSSSPSPSAPAAFWRTAGVHLPPPPRFVQQPALSFGPLSSSRMSCSRATRCGPSPSSCAAGRHRLTTSMRWSASLVMPHCRLAR